MMFLAGRLPRPSGPGGGRPSYSTGKGYPPRELAPQLRLPPDRSWRPAYPNPAVIGVCCETRLRRRAAGYGRSMEEEARLILAEAVSREAAPERGLGTAIHALFKPFGGVELELPPRESMREPPRFD